MTINEIIVRLNNLFDAGVNFKLYIGVPSDNGIEYRLADLSNASTEAICHTYIESIRNYFDNDDLSLLNLSELDARADVLYRYDYEDLPEQFNQIEGLLDPQEPVFFNGEENSLADVKSIVIKVNSANDSVLFYKTIYPVSLVKRTQILLYESDERLTSLDKDILKINGGFDLMAIGGDFYISNYSKFEKAFSFELIARQIMQDVSERILALEIVNDLKNYIADIKGPRKHLLRASKSDVLALDRDTILAFVTQKQGLLGLIIEDGRIHLNSKESVKVLLKILNDDILWSGLTNRDYDSLAKNKL